MVYVAEWLHCDLNERGIFMEIMSTLDDKGIAQIAQYQKASHVVLYKAFTLIDLTSLNGNDTADKISNLVEKGLPDLDDGIVNFASVNTEAQRILDEDDRSRPVSSNLVQWLRDYTTDGRFDPEKFFHAEGYRVYGICVYPTRVADVLQAIENVRQRTFERTGKKLDFKLEVSSVAGGFPSGQYPLNSKLEEIKYAIGEGATEIDATINRSFVIDGKWVDLYEEIEAYKRCCESMNPAVKLKTILSTHECGSLNNVYKASMVAMMAGSDYIKTSTGKDGDLADFSAAVVMCRAIQFYFQKTGRRVGFKAAGGIKAAHDASRWFNFMLEMLGPDWLPYFRIGASSLADCITERFRQV